MPNQTNKKNQAGKGTGFASILLGSGMFIKFFFWFWLTVVLTGTLVAAYGYIYHFRPENHRLLALGREFLEDNGQMVVDAYETTGSEAALEVRLPGAFWLYDENLNIIFAPAQTQSSRRNYKRPPRYQNMLKALISKEPEVREIARQLLAGDKIDSAEVAGEMLIGCVLLSESDKKYVIIRHFPQRMPRPYHFLLSRVIDTMPFFLLITAVICYILSRYMVRPISELRQASRNFASGRFDARVTKIAISRRDEIGDLAVDFNDMADKIEQMISSQRRLFGDISHELRSPLARLQVAVELLQKKIPAAEQPMLARIENEVARINSLIEEVLQFSRLESGNYRGERKQINLNDILEHICNDANFEGKARNCTVKLTMAGDVNISGIEQLIGRAIENVLRNALKYSPQNSQVDVDLQLKDNLAIISIADTGPGILPGEIDKVFEMFYRCAEDRNRSTGGNGLGLAIARHAIMLHNGKISLKNRNNGGLLATIAIPLS